MPSYANKSRGTCEICCQPIDIGTRFEMITRWNGRDFLKVHKACAERRRLEAQAAQGNRTV